MKDSKSNRREKKIPSNKRKVEKGPESPGYFLQYGCGITAKERAIKRNKKRAARKRELALQEQKAKEVVDSSAKETDVRQVSETRVDADSIFKVYEKVVHEARQFRFNLRALVHNFIFFNHNIIRFRRFIVNFNWFASHGKPPGCNNGLNAFRYGKNAENTKL